MSKFFRHFFIFPPSKSSGAQSTIPPYLRENSWEKELNFKLWVTMGSRFRADQRNKTKALWSQIAITLLTSYLIIISIIPLVPKILAITISIDQLSFAGISVSIILLAYSLIEGGRNYELRAHCFHTCGLEISRLYSDLRQTKEVIDDNLRKETIHRITSAYNDVLEEHINHDPIDLLTFKTSKSDYFEFPSIKIIWIWMRYYFQTIFIYHLLIVVPPIAFWMLHKASVSN